MAMNRPVVIVGAGLSGLVCARRLHQAGLPVLILESSDRPGGRMKTDTVDGFRLDRGFQVYFDQYPTARLELDLARLDLRRYEPGCLVWDGQKQHEVHRENILHTLFSGWVPISDLMRIATWGQEVKEMSFEDVWDIDDVTIPEFLRGRGFSEKFIDRFVRPFFGGVFLDRSLNDSARPFLFYWKCLEQGYATTPADGIEAIPAQVAADLPAELFRFNTRVAKLVEEDGRVTGVLTEGGETIEAERVILATDAATLRDLAGVPVPVGQKSCTTVHFAVPESPVDEGILVVNGLGRGDVNHVAVPSKVARGLAPAGQHLVSATLLGLPPEDDMYVAKSVRYELTQWFPKANVAAWRPLRVDRIPFAQVGQPVGYAGQRPEREPRPGLVVAGEAATYLGIDGAVRAGQDAAVAVLSQLREPVRA